MWCFGNLLPFVPYVKAYAAVIPCITRFVSVHFSLSLSLSLYTHFRLICLKTSHVFHYVNKNVVQKGVCSPCTLQARYIIIDGNQVYLFPSPIVTCLTPSKLSGCVTTTTLALTFLLLPNQKNHMNFEP